MCCAGVARGGTGTSDGHFQIQKRATVVSKLYGTNRSTRPYGNSILKDSIMINGGFASCEIPPELMREHAGRMTADTFSPTFQTDESSDNVHSSNDKAVLSSRGGYQGGNDDSYEPPDMHGTFDMVQEQYYDQVHHDMHHQRDQEYYQPSSP